MAEEAERKGEGDPQWGEEAGKYVMSVAVKMTGVDAHRIRKYEEARLLTPARSAGGQRLFSDRDIAQIREIAALEREGVNLKGIEKIILLKEGQERDGSDNPTS